MFDPKITEGKWKYEPVPDDIEAMFVFSKGENATCIATTNQFKELKDGGRENAKAIAAIPELLDVLEKARFCSKWISYEDLEDKFYLLSKSIQRLDEKHD
jgi:hypothetical protein